MEELFRMPQVIFLIPIVAIVFGTCAGMVKSVATASRKTAEAKEREESRREIAAYVAEGSMSPEDAERLIRAGTKADIEHA